MKKRVINDDVYGLHFTLIYDLTEKEFGKYLEKTHAGYKHEYKNNIGEVVTLEHQKHGLYLYLFISKFNGSIESYDLLCHEVFHLTTRILKTVGINHSDETEEAYAYFYAYLIKKILPILIDHVKKNEILAKELTKHSKKRIKKVIKKVKSKKL